MLSVLEHLSRASKFFVGIMKKRFIPRRERINKSRRGLVLVGREQILNWRNHMFQYKYKIVALAAMLLPVVPLTSMAEEPVVQTQGTVIYLADNLNEEAKLGWCIDTQGRGFSEKLHSHSCKPGGGDTQFSYDATSGMIQSVEFEGKCMTLNAADNAEIPFGLLECVEGDVTQQFIYDTDSMEFRIAADELNCVTVAETIIEAGPFQSRYLIFAPCSDLSPSYKEWVVRK